jgi:hypothetical protein
MNERQRLRAWVAVSSERFAALIPAPSLAGVGRVATVAGGDARG